jgi:hypothetical protein
MSYRTVWMCAGNQGRGRCGNIVEWGEDCENCKENTSGQGRYASSTGDEKMKICENDDCGELNDWDRSTCLECGEGL